MATFFCRVPNNTSWASLESKFASKMLANGFAKYNLEIATGFKVPLQGNLFWTYI